MTPDNKDTKKNKLNLTIESLEMELMDPDSKAKKAAASKPADSTAKKSEAMAGTDANLPVQYRQQGGDNRALKTYSSNLQKAEESDSEVRKKGRMGDRMVAQGLITESQLNVALQPC